MQRSLLIFENSIKSTETMKTYLYYVDDFISQFDLKDYDDLASTPQDKLQIMLIYVKSIGSSFADLVFNINWNSLR